MGTRVAASNFPDKNLTGVSQLLDDLQCLSEDYESADIVFLVGREEVPVYAHRIILMARCKSFQNGKRGEVCRISIPGCTVSPPSTSGGRTPISLPQVQVDTFRKFILYVYTGRIMLQDNAFEMMNLAQDLGLEELRSTCEDFITSTLSPSSASKFLAVTMDTQEKTAGGKYTKSFIDRCIAYIEENASACVQTNSFLTLPKDALIKLISSDSFALEEEEVWRAVLNWAKYQAGVTQPTAHWTEEERARVGQHLNGVINHVRLLLIDSQVFAEEVEPTGAVPIEMSLERYRYAALPHKFRERSDHDKRMLPRVFLNIGKLFLGSQILGQVKMRSFEKLLNSWYGNPTQCWRLLYRASTHGFSAETFHRLCDGAAPIFVIVLGASGAVCGGFSDTAFVASSTRSNYAAADKAFLFSLTNRFGNAPLKFDLIRKVFGVAYHKNCGPIFGAGADLLISDNCNHNTLSYSNLPHSYDGEKASRSILMGYDTFRIEDYEVFTTV